MAEALVSVVLEQFAFLAAQQIKHEWSLVSGIEDKVESLATNLEGIQMVLLDAENRQIKERSVKHWLDRLKAVSYEIDAVLDEWNTAIILRSNLKLFSKVCFFTTHPCFYRNQVHRPGLRRRIAFKIEKLNEKLDKISKDKERYTFTIWNFSLHTFGGTTTYSIEHERRPNTTSFVDESEVYGRDEEKKILVDMLMSASSQATRMGPDIISILGMGGIGKTTLAQLVYNDEKINNHFSLKIWVPVSDPFDEITIARAIAKALKVKDVHNLVDFQAFSEHISESIRDKRFLLVLDDVWTEDHRKWEPLEKSLKNGAVESKILVTTRKREVATMMKVTQDHTISIEYLSEMTCLEIFNKLAFFDKKESEELKKIGEKIAQKCKGLPLVAKALGNLMRFKEFTKEHWEEVLDSELWKLGRQFENEVFVPLLLSYYDLPSFEKTCLLFCSYFPKHYTIHRDELVQLWMSQGYLGSTKSDERKSVNCFENLAGHAFFQDFERDEYENNVRCKMHDIVHDFILFLTKNEFLNTRVKTKEDGMKLLQAKAFHRTLLIESEEQEIHDLIYSKKNLRTLSLSIGKLGSIRWDLLVKLTCLRTLNLRDCSSSEIPNNIDKLILLRYIDLSHNRRLRKLPKTLGNLFNLQTLKLEDCGVLKLPKEMEKLINLRHLYLGDDALCPRELGKLPCLETLNILRVRRSEYKEVMKLEDLNKLNHLKGRLHISGLGNIQDENQAESAQLKEKKHLVSLVLGFDKGMIPEIGTAIITALVGLLLEILQEGLPEEGLLEGLEPHPNLKHLEIYRYGGTTLSPNWMTSSLNLKRLVLRHCKCESLGPFGKLKCLESLTIEGMGRLKRVGQEFLGIEDTTSTEEVGKMENNGSTFIPFPNLKRLELFEIYAWEEWESCAATSNSCPEIMPRLVSLEIISCPALKAPLPEFLRRTPLRNLTIEYCPSLGQRFGRGSSDTKELIEILTSPISSKAVTIWKDDDPQTSRHGDISSVDDDENNISSL